MSKGNIEFITKEIEERYFKGEMSEKKSKGAENIILYINKNKFYHPIDWMHHHKLLDIYWSFPAIMEQGSHNGKLGGISKKKNIKRVIGYKINRFYKYYILRNIIRRFK